MSHQDISGDDVASAIDQLVAAFGLDPERVEITIDGESPSGDSPDDDPLTGIEDKSWNDLQSIASDLGIYDPKMTKDEVIEALRGFDGDIEDVESDDPEGVVAEAKAASSTEEAKTILKENNATPKEWREVFGECQSRRDCGLSANGREEDLCYDCSDRGLSPEGATSEGDDPEGVDLTGSRATVAEALIEDEGMDAVEALEKVADL